MNSPATNQAIADIMAIDCLNNRGDVEKFFALLSSFVAWHPDDAFNEYVHLSGERVFSDAEALHCDQLLDQAWALCNIWQVDIYGLALDQLQAALKSRPISG